MQLHRVEGISQDQLQCLRHIALSCERSSHLVPDVGALKTASEDLTEVDRANDGVRVVLANQETLKVIELTSG